MQGYHYKTGDRPLEGYTIQRGVGRGAFGEVYYSLSDSGREVALKTILGYEQIELRGVSQCMNLKSPHLVAIFDLRRNEQGQNFVIMEYVAGPSLRELLDESPSGLGPQKTAFFLREIGKGLTYLHDRGIVHRDLKPGNIFYEDGYVKIGDYGLSKAISPSQHSGQTITVGTVHYMAPEIGQGRYDRSIDIYAMGVLVFEMLTGHVPFFGASQGEVLMKHLVETPDVSGIEEPFATVIRKAMAKDPAERYQTVQEMVEAVFGAEHIQESVSVFRPESLSMVAERAGRKVVTVGGPGSSAELPGTLGGDRPREAGSSDVWLEFGRKMDQAVERLGTAKDRMLSSRERIRGRFHDRISEIRERRTASSTAAPASDADLADPMTQRQRMTLATVVAIVVA
ncbi:MAG: serine/threonine protein kinase, partial [Planctomycetes bacterium]|nr:serine/threonine protein kinase [Planctomycetota bacterium]